MSWKACWRRTGFQPVFLSCLSLLILFVGQVEYQSYTVKSETMRSTSFPTTLRHALLCAIVVSHLLGCSRKPATGPTRPAVLRLATTTSTRDSGLLDKLLPIFEKSADCRVDVIAVGSGTAFRLGEMGEVDVILAHAPAAEEAFMAHNHGFRHEEFMANEFLILGPQSDPAGIENVDPVAAMTQIAEGGHPFVSRGDDSGTHSRERSLWESAGGRPEWKEYIESGQGMGPTLIVAFEKQAYVLSDMGTYLKFRGKIDLVPLAAHSKALNNPYSVIGVNPKKHSKVNAADSQAFIDFLISDETQRMIANYKIGDQNLFLPTRIGAK